MHVKRLIDLMNKDEGSGLLLALMTLMVLSVLGASLGAITFGSYKLGAVNRDDNSAYYIAEAGANIAYEELEKGVLNVYEDANKADFFPKVDSLAGEVTEKINLNEDDFYEFENQFGDDPTVTVAINKIEESDSVKYEIVSTGEVAGKARSVIKPVEVTWVDMNPGFNLYIPDNAAIISRESIEINQNSGIEGDIHIDALSPPGLKATKDFEFNGSVYFHPETEGNYNKVTQGGVAKKIENLKTREEALPWADYEALVTNFPKLNNLNFPELPNKSIPNPYNGTQYSVQRNGDLILDQEFLNGYTLDLNQDTHINELTLLSSRDLNINTFNKDIKISVNNFELKGGDSDINIIGNGSVTFFVRDKFVVDSGSTLNGNGKTSQLTVYWEGNNGMFDLWGSQKINGNLFFNNSSVNIAASAKLNGSLLVRNGTVDFSGSQDTQNIILLAPFSTVNVSGSKIMSGTLIANAITQNGGTRISYSENKEFDFPFGPAGSSDGSGGSLDDIITSKPAIE